MQTKLQVNLTKEQKQQLAAKAKSEGRTLSGYVLYHLLLKNNVNVDLPLPLE